MQPITVPQGPTVSRGLLSILGTGMDLGGAGATDFLAGTPAFSDPLDPLDRWMNGYYPVSIPCGRLTGLLPPEHCDTGTAAVMVPAEDEEDPPTEFDQSTSPWEIGPLAQPFDVLGPKISCSMLGLGGKISNGEALEMARTAHRDLLWRAIAHELWTGTLATAQGFDDNRRLAGPDTVVLDEGVSLPYALYLLEGAVARAASRDERVLIHTPWSMLPFFACSTQLVSTPNSDRLWTPGGSHIVADVGYPGTGPEGQSIDPDEDTGIANVWLFATTHLAARLDTAESVRGVAPTTSGGLGINVPTNDVAVQYRQTAAITFPCQVFGVSVAIGG